MNQVEKRASAAAAAMLVAVAAMLVTGVLGAAVQLVGACVVPAARVVAAAPVVAAVLAAAAELGAHITGRRLLLPATQMLLTATQISSQECKEGRKRCRKATSVGHSSDMLLYPARESIARTSLAAMAAQA